ncbi:MAG: hypothetical protein U9R19_11230, partial [Bacteroidota bacterium]|nr:hypothetical protein [Bacteroidota bacterium]
GGVNAYVDEQSLAGDPFMGMGGEPETTWSTPYNTSAYPYNCYIDLGQNYDLASIYLFDKSSSGNLTISIGEPGNWTPIFTDPCQSYKSWQAHIVDVNSRYIRISKEVPTANAAEILVYVK